MRRKSKGFNKGFKHAARIMANGEVYKARPTSSSRGGCGMLLYYLICIIMIVIGIPMMNIFPPTSILHMAGVPFIIAGIYGLVGRGGIIRVIAVAVVLTGIFSLILNVGSSNTEYSWYEYDNSIYYQ